MQANCYLHTTVNIDIVMWHCLLLPTKATIAVRVTFYIILSKLVKLQRTLFLSAGTNAICVKKLCGRPWTKVNQWLCTAQHLLVTKHLHTAASKVKQKWKRNKQCNFQTNCCIFLQKKRCAQNFNFTHHFSNIRISDRKCCWWKTIFR